MKAYCVIKVWADKTGESRDFIARKCATLEGAIRAKNEERMFNNLGDSQDSFYIEEKNI